MAGTRSISASMVFGSAANLRQLCCRRRRGRLKAMDLEVALVCFLRGAFLSARLRIKQVLWQGGRANTASRWPGRHIVIYLHAASRCFDLLAVIGMVCVGSFLPMWRCI